MKIEPYKGFLKEHWFIYFLLFILAIAQLSIGKPLVAVWILNTLLSLILAARWKRLAEKTLDSLEKATHN